MKALVGTFNQEKALVGAFSVIVQPVVEPMEHYTSLITKDEEPRRPGQRLPTSMLGNELMNKEQLYDLFQQVLNVKKFEHQLLYNAMQVGVTGHCLFLSRIRTY